MFDKKFWVVLRILIFCNVEWGYMQFFIGPSVNVLNNLRNDKSWPVIVYPKLVDYMGFDMLLHNGRMFNDLCDAVNGLETQDMILRSVLLSNQCITLQKRLERDNTFRREYMLKHYELYGMSMSDSPLVEMNDMVREIVVDQLKPFINMLKT